MTRKFTTGLIFLAYFGIVLAMLKLKADKREKFGKSLKKEREAGKMPAVLYGEKTENDSLMVDAKEFKQIFDEAGESTVLSLETPNGAKDVLIHDVAWHPLSGKPLHVDFYAIDSSKPVTVTVPLEFIGVAPGVKNHGGILVKVLHEVEISVLPKDLPQSIDVDISKLENIDDAIHAEDLELPESAKLETNSEETVVLVSAVSEEEEEEETEAPDFDSIEVEKKGKREEDESEEGSESKDSE